MSSQNLERDLQLSIESIMKKIQYESYEEWVKNFSLNLNDIWNESSAKDLVPSEEYSNKIQSSIVIGRGPSIKKHNHLQILAQSNFKGNIVCCDGKLIDTLKAGVTPDKFPNFYVITIDPYESIKKNYDDPIVDKYGKKIKGIFTVLTNPLAVERARSTGMPIYWIHSLFDYNEGKKSFNQISALIIRAKKNQGLPAIQTGGNVGTSSWFVAWKILKSKNICLIGINHGWEEEDSWDTILSHGNNPSISKELDRNSPSFEQLFKKIYNPDFECYSIVDPLFQFYSMALKEFISRSPNWVNTINATEGGSIFGNRITSMKFNDFLLKF